MLRNYYINTKISSIVNDTKTYPKNKNKNRHKKKNLIKEYLKKILSESLICSHSSTTTTTTTTTIEEFYLCSGQGAREPLCKMGKLMNYININIITLI